MRSFNISDLNTDVGKLRCNERNTKATVSKKYIQESLQKVLDTQQADKVMDEIYLNRQVITKYTLSRVKKARKTLSLRIACRDKKPAKAPDAVKT